MKLRTGPDDRGLRLDHFLTRHIENVTRSQLQQLNRSGAVHIDGRQEKSGYRISGDETIEIDFHGLEATPLMPLQMPLQIHFEDADLAVVEKPAGVTVHPGSGTRGATLVHGLLHHFQTLSDSGGQSRPGIVHRIDKKTSGLLIIAKNNVAHSRLGRAFQDRRIEKTYIALVHGKFAQSSGAVDLAIGRHPTIRTRMAPRAEGRTAHTSYKVIDTLDDFSLLEVKIKTGRTHQIRVHLTAIGHPVVGDDVYGESKQRAFVKKYGDFDRYFLHSAHLRFAHPTADTILDFHSELPVELQNLMRRLRS